MITSSDVSRGCAKEAKSGAAATRQEAARLEEVLAHLDAGQPLSDFPGELPKELEPLTTKPLIAIVNGPDGIDCKLEMELAELPRRRRRSFEMARQPSTG